MTTKRKYQEQDINWEDLNAMGITKDFLQEEGHLEKLLSGEVTDFIPMQLTLLGTQVSLEASLQLVIEDDKIRIMIDGFQSTQNN